MDSPWLLLPWPLSVYDRAQSCLLACHGREILMVSRAASICSMAGIVARERDGGAAGDGRESSGERRWLGQGESPSRLTRAVRPGRPPGDRRQGMGWREEINLCLVWRRPVR